MIHVAVVVIGFSIACAFAVLKEAMALHPTVREIGSPLPFHLVVQHATFHLHLTRVVEFGLFHTTVLLVKITDYARLSIGELRHHLLR